MPEVEKLLVQESAWVGRMPQYRTLLLAGVLVLGMAGFFLLDVLTPPGVADGIGYPILLILCLWLPGRRTLAACAGTAAALTVIGAAFGRTGGVGFEASLINRGMAFATIWIVYFLLVQRRATEDRLRASEQKAMAASQAKSRFLANMSH